MVQDYLNKSPKHHLYRTPSAWGLSAPPEPTVTVYVPAENGKSDAVTPPPAPPPSP